MSKRVKKLSLDDQKVWRHVTQTVIPYGDPLEIDAFEDEIDQEEALKSVKPEKTRLRSTADSYSPPVQTPKTKMKSSDLHPIERPVHKKIAKGRVTIDARIDLHGMTQQIAHRALYNFLTDAYLCGDRHVLVITGKGSSSGGRGILRQVVPEWFKNPDFKELVSGFRSSAQHHGGDGALYVRLRRKHDPRN